MDSEVKIELDAVQVSDKAQMTPEDKLKSIQDKWVKTVSELNGKMKDLAGLDSLLNEIYSKRQDLCDYMFSVLNILGRLTRSYKTKYAERYNYYKLGKNGLRYNNDSAIATQIDAELEDEKANISMISNNVDFCKETLKTIDNMIYGVNQKIKIYELINGIK